MFFILYLFFSPHLSHSCQTPFSILEHLSTNPLSTTAQHHQKPAICSWDFGGLHGSKFSLGENPFKCAGDIHRQIALFYSLEMEIRRLVGLHIVSAWKRSFSLEKKFWLVFGFHRSSTSRHLNLHYLWNTFPNFLNVYWNSSSCLSHNPLNKAIVEHWLNLWHTWMNLYLFITATMLLNYAQVEQADSNEIETGYDTVTFSVCLFVSDIKWKSHNLNISKNYQGFHLWECFWDTSIYKIYMFSVTKVAKIK